MTVLWKITYSELITSLELDNSTPKIPRCPKVAGFSDYSTSKIPRSQTIAGFSDKTTSKFLRSQKIAGFSEHWRPKIPQSQNIAGSSDNSTPKMPRCQKLRHFRSTGDRKSRSRKTSQDFWTTWLRKSRGVKKSWHFRSTGDRKLLDFGVCHCMSPYRAGHYVQWRTGVLCSTEYWWGVRFSIHRELPLKGLNTTVFDKLTVSTNTPGCFLRLWKWS